MTTLRRPPLDAVTIYRHDIRRIGCDADTMYDARIAQQEVSKLIDDVCHAVMYKYPTMLGCSDKGFSSLGLRPGDVFLTGDFGIVGICDDDCGTLVFWFLHAVSLARKWTETPYRMKSAIEQYINGTGNKESSPFYPDMRLPLGSHRYLLRRIGPGNYLPHPKYTFKFAMVHSNKNAWVQLVYTANYAKALARNDPDAYSVCFGYEPESENWHRVRAWAVGEKILKRQDDWSHEIVKQTQRIDSGRF